MIMKLWRTCQAGIKPDVASSTQSVQKYFSWQSRVCPVKGFRAISVEATERGVRGEPLWPNVDTSRFILTVMVAKVIMPTQDWASQIALPEVLGTHTQCLLCSSTYSTLKLSIYLGRQDQGEPQLNYHTKEAPHLFSTFSVLSPLLSPLHHQSSRLPLTTVISPRAQRKDHWITHTKVCRTADVHPHKKKKVYF